MQARQGKARQDKAIQDKARQGKTRQGKVRQIRQREGKAREGKATRKGVSDANARQRRQGDQKKRKNRTEGSGTRYTGDPIIEEHVYGFIKEKVETWCNRNKPFYYTGQCLVNKKGANLNIQKILFK